MIAEALLYAATVPMTLKEHRRFIRTSVNLWSRAGRCSRQWAGHEERSRNAVTSAMAGLRQKRTAVVLGSGLLRDVPIEELSENFDTVVLVDLVHLASVRLCLRLKGYSNVRLIERDLSGYDELAAGRQPEPLAFLRTVPYLDFVVSANLLSQIGRGAKRRYEAEEEGAMPADTVTQLIEAHRSALEAAPCRTCLIPIFPMPSSTAMGRFMRSMTCCTACRCHRFKPTGNGPWRRLEKRARTIRSSTRSLPLIEVGVPPWPPRGSWPNLRPSSTNLRQKSQTEAVTPG